MKPEDDPEARIRELERPLSDVARATELGTDQYSSGYPPPPPTYPLPPMPGQTWSAGPPFGAPRPPNRTKLWLVLLAAAVGLIAVAGGVVAYSATRVTSGLPTFGTPSRAPGGGGTFGSTPSTRVRSGTEPPRTALPPVAPPESGQRLSVSGIGENRNLTCDDSTVSISGVSNTVVITGHCANVQISGVSNTVTIDSSGQINASGIQNHITFHTGEPEINNSGSENTVEQG